MDDGFLTDLIFALGLILAAEGFLYALFPNTMRRILEVALRTPPDELRLVALLVAGAGVALIALARS
ncbi:MAG: DUF2065 domain-containing protein [Pseudomonadota bacterium]